MIISKLQGGLGNQMFQYAIARSLSLKSHKPFMLDLSFLQKHSIPRTYDLDIFNISPDFNNSFLQNTVHINEPHYHYSEGYTNLIVNLLNNNYTILLDGHWQSERFFLEFKEEIKKDFKFIDKINNLELLKVIESTDSIMLNVRRTDYLQSSFHGVMKLDYFEKAKQIIETKIKKPHYFIFSDDLDWCKKNLKWNNTTIVDHQYKGNKFSLYLQLMLSCKHFIIPNSTFAWWAAWLGSNEDKIVIAPKQWFTDSTINTSDLIPLDWIRI